MKLYQKFRITGVANDTVYDSGLVSTPAEPKTLLALFVQLDKYAATDDNEFVASLETTQVLDIPEKLFPTELFSNVVQAADGGKLNRIEVGQTIQTGETYKVGMKCSATPVNSRGVYEYEITKT